MQIDCSVVNTTIVQLKSDALPGSLRKKSEDTKSPLYDNPKTNKRTNKTNDSLPILHNSSDTNSNYSNNSQPKNSDLGQEDAFASYLVTKYEHTKNDAARNKQRMSSGQKYNNDTKTP